MVFLLVGAVAAWAGFFQGVRGATLGPVDPMLIMPGVLLGAPLTGLFVWYRRGCLAGWARRVRWPAVGLAAVLSVAAGAVAWAVAPGFWGWVPAGLGMVAVPVLADVAAQAGRPEGAEGERR